MQVNSNQTPKCFTTVFGLQARRKWGGGRGGPVPPHFLADQLTLSQPGGAHYPHPVLRAPPDFQILRRPWNKKMNYISGLLFVRLILSIVI